jgi:hypothetical protein
MPLRKSASTIWYTSLPSASFWTKSPTRESNAGTRSVSTKTALQLAQCQLERESDRRKDDAYFSSNSRASQHLPSSHRHPPTPRRVSMNVLSGSTRLRFATASEPHRRRSPYMSLLDKSMISSFMRYWCVRSTTACGCASESLRNSETSRPPFLAAGLRT